MLTIYIFFSGKIQAKSRQEILKGGKIQVEFIVFFEGLIGSYSKMEIAKWTIFSLF